MRVSWPIILSNLTVPLLGVVDTAVLGHLDDPSQLAGVVLGATIFSFLYWGVGFLRIGTTALIAQAVGRNAPDRVAATLIRSIILAAIFAGVIFALQILPLWVAHATFNSEPPVMQAMEGYYNIGIYGALPTLVVYCLMGWLVGCERPKLLLVVTVTINGTNIVLDIVFVYGMGLEAGGVALASVLAQTVGMVMIGWFAWQEKLFMDWREQALVSFDSYIALLKINGYLFCRNLIMIFGFTWFVMKGAEFGVVILAANAVTMNFFQIAAFAFDGFAMAIETLVGQSVGARDRKKFQQQVKALM
ncbi:MAG: MATE family efflux transporter, partial [Pseudomonadota bacterium]